MKSNTICSIVALLGGFILAVPCTVAATTTDKTPPAHECGRDQKHDPEKRLAHLTKKLGLSVDQQAKLRVILTELETQRQNIDATPLTGPQRRDQMKLLHECARSKIAAVLTPDQIKLFKEMEAKRRDRLHERLEKGEGCQPPSPGNGGE